MTLSIGMPMHAREHLPECMAPRIIANSPVHLPLPWPALPAAHGAIKKKSGKRISYSRHNYFDLALPCQRCLLPPRHRLLLLRFLHEHKHT